MPIDVIGCTSVKTVKKIDTSSFVQKCILINNYIESDVEENIDMKTQFKIKKLFQPTTIRKAASRLCVEIKFTNPSRIINIAHVDFIDKDLDNVCFIKFNSYPVTGEDAAAN